MDSKQRSAGGLSVNPPLRNVGVHWHVVPSGPLASQAWLASRGPLLQQMATQKHLWGEVAAAVQVGAPLDGVPGNRMGVGCSR